MAELRLLCLDGGGVRGLTSLYMLKQLLSHFGDEKPCHFFDMIAGTSTGGLIAIMLGCLEMTVDECINAFLRLMGTIFQGRSTLPFSIVSGKVKPRYSTRVFEEKIKEIIVENGLPANAKMRQTAEPRCKTFVVTVSGLSKDIVHFTNYKKPDEMSDFYDKVQIWEAARATSAATTFFDSITIDGSLFWDGGAGANNPVNRLWREAGEVFGPDLESKICCLLSIGTGLPPPTNFGSSLYDVTRSLIDIATGTQNTHLDFLDNHRTLVDRNAYFRFNPPYLDEVGLDQPQKQALIRERTERYGRDEFVRQQRRLFQDAASRRIRHRRVTPIPRPGPTRRFYALNNRPEYIRQDVNNYWHHLTLPAYEIYESIVLDCQNRSTEHGHIDLSAFLRCFEPDRSPSQTRVQEVWQRLLRKGIKIQGSKHRPPFAMACLYMLHIEEARGYHVGPPPDLNDPTEDRREALKRYDVWTPCRCARKCGRQWNFANDIGLCRGGEERKKCDVDAFLRRSPTRNLLFHKSTSDTLETMRTAWKQPMRR